MVGRVLGQWAITKGGFYCCDPFEATARWDFPTRECILWKPQSSWKSKQTTTKKLSKFTQKNHTCRWYNDTQSCKIFCPNSAWFVRYKNNKFLTNHLDNFLAWNLLFLYLTNEIEFGQDILQDCVSSYHLHVWFSSEFRQIFYRSLHGFSRRLWFSPDMFASNSRRWLAKDLVASL